MKLLTGSVRKSSLGPPAHGYTTRMFFHFQQRARQAPLIKAAAGGKRLGTFGQFWVRGLHYIIGLAVHIMGREQTERHFPAASRRFSPSLLRKIKSMFSLLGTSCSCCFFPDKETAPAGRATAAALFYPAVPLLFNGGRGSNPPLCYHTLYPSDTLYPC